MTTQTILTTEEIVRDETGRLLARIIVLRDALEQLKEQLAQRDAEIAALKRSAP